MERLFWPAAVMALSGAMLAPPPAVASTPEITSTQVVNFALDGSFCPQHGLYGIAHVDVDGTRGMTADQNFIWTTQVAATPIHSVPREGAVANVTIVYHCNVQVLWWLEPGPAHKVSAALWVNGSGEQPSYVIRPGQPPSHPAPPQTSSPAPQPDPSQTTMPEPPTTSTLEPAPPQAFQPTPSPTSQTLQPVPSPEPSPTSQPSLQPEPSPTASQPPSPTSQPTLPATSSPTPPPSSLPVPPPTSQPAPPTTIPPTPQPTLTPTPTPSPTPTPAP